MSHAPGCLTDEQIADVVADSADSLVLEHLRVCGICQAAVAKMRRQLSNTSLQDELALAYRESRNQSAADLSRTEAFAYESWLLVQGVPAAIKVDEMPVGNRKNNDFRSAPRFQNGDRLGDFVVEKPLGHGGQSEVYLVRRNSDEFRGLLVAKVCRDPSSGMACEALRREAAYLDRLKGCPGIVQFQHIHELPIKGGETEPCLILEYINGQTLKQSLNRYHDNPAAAVQLVARLGRILACAHNKGVVHGDLKPGNIVLLGEKPDDPRIIDFGLAMTRTVYETGEDQKHMGGTILYMPPEQGRQQATELTPAADVFALGVILQELLCRKPVYAGSGFDEVREQVRNGAVQVAALEELPFRGLWQRRRRRKLHHVLQRSLAVQHERRFADGEKFAQALEPGAGRWPVAAGILAVVLATVGMLVANAYWNRPLSGPAAPIPGLLTVTSGLPNELARRLPVMLNDRVRLSSEVPEGLQWHVIWVDRDRKVQTFSVDSSLHPVGVEPHAERGVELVSWPPSPDDVRIEGIGGTEMVLLVGTKAGDPAGLSRIKARLESSLSAGDWPDLPGNLVLRWNLIEVQEVFADGTSRGVGDGDAVPYLRVAATLKRLQNLLKEDCSYLRGEVFLVNRLD